MYKKNEAQSKRLEQLYKKIKLFYGAIPPQMEFLGNIEAEYLEDFIKVMSRIAKHPHIDPNWFGFVRLHIAFREDYAYCKAFNTKFLLSREYKQQQLDAVIDDIADLPFDQKHQALAQHALKVIYESKNCTQSDLDALYEMGWTQKDVFDGVEHALTLFRNGRILTAYSKKD